MNTRFPYVEDASGQEFGEGTWTKVTEMLTARFRPFNIARRNKMKVCTGAPQSKPLSLP